MKVKKIINNNVVISQDQNENEIIIFGKGIGYNKVAKLLVSLLRDWKNIHPVYRNFLLILGNNVSQLANR